MCLLLVFLSAVVLDDTAVAAAGRGKEFLRFGKHGLNPTKTALGAANRCDGRG